VIENKQHAFTLRENQIISFRISNIHGDRGRFGRDSHQNSDKIEKSRMPFPEGMEKQTILSIDTRMENRA